MPRRAGPSRGSRENRSARCGLETGMGRGAVRVASRVGLRRRPLLWIFAPTIPKVFPVELAHPPRADSLDRPCPPLSAVVVLQPLNDDRSGERRTTAVESS